MIVAGSRNMCRDNSSASDLGPGNRIRSGLGGDYDPGYSGRADDGSSPFPALLCGYSLRFTKCCSLFGRHEPPTGAAVNRLG